MFIIYIRIFQNFTQNLAVYPCERAEGDGQLEKLRFDEHAHIPTFVVNDDFGK